MKSTLVYSSRVHFYIMITE